MELRSNLRLWIHYLMTTLSPKWSIRFQFRRCHHRRLDLKNPQTLDEKIQWMKLYYYKDNALVNQCADKVRVRDYVRDCGLSDILNEVLAVYQQVDQIEWSALPEKFVMKWNFGNGGNVVCTDKAQLDIPKAEKELRSFQKIKFHLISYEPQYIFPKQLLCERFIEPSEGVTPVDYKVYCFNGEAKYVLCCYGRGRQARPNFYFFDRQWQLQRFNRQGQQAPEGFTIPKPEGIDRLFECAERLSKPFPFVRADFYLEHGQVWFGELTFTPSGGFDYGRLPETDLLFGQMVQLPDIDTLQR